MSQSKQEPTVPSWTIGDRLRKAREITGLDQGDFAERIGLSRNTVGSYESGRGKKPPRGIVLNAWALATGVDRHWLEHGGGVLADNRCTLPSDLISTSLQVTGLQTVSA